MMSGYRK